MNMFCDERINQACGKIYSRGILLAVLYTALFAAARVLLTGGLRLSHFLTELAILATGVIILLVGLIRWGFARDERRIFEKHNYYLAAGKIFVVAALAGYAVSIPLRLRVGNDYPVNELILHLETLGCVYFFYAFKRESVNFNYTFIDGTNGSYYRRVFLNIAKLAGILFIPFLAAGIMDLAIHQSPGYFLNILVSYVTSVVGLGLDYLLLSVLEKLNYDEESPRALKKGTTVALYLAIGAEAMSALLTVAQGFLLRFSLVSDMGKLMQTITTVIVRWAYPCIIITALGLCFLLEQTRRSRWIRVGIGGLLILQTVDLALTPVKSVLMLTMERLHTSDNQLLPLYADVMNVWSFLLWLGILGFTCVVIHGLVRDFRAPRLLWLTVALIPLCYGLGIFFVSQGMYMARALAVNAGGVLVSLWQLVLLQRVNMQETCRKPAGRVDQRPQSKRTEK